MLDTLNALTPIFAVIALGAALGRTGFADQAFWRQADKLVYFLCFPALLISTIATVDLGDVGLLPMVASFFGAIIVCAVSLALIKRHFGARLGITGPAFSSMFQGTVRFNTFVALATILPLYGPEGMAFGALLVGCAVPFVNAMSVAVLARYGESGGATVGRILRTLSKNPLILACIAGFVLNLTGIGLPGPIKPTVDLIGRVALTLGLMSVGAGLDLGALRAVRTNVAITCALQLVVKPLTCALLLAIFGVGGVEAAVAIIFAAVPTASSSYILARQLGGDSTLMAGLVTATTLCAFVTMPIMLAILT